MQFDLPPNRTCVVCKDVKSLTSFPPASIGVGMKDTCNECCTQQVAYWQKACNNLPVFVTDDKKWEFFAAELSWESESNHLVYQVNINRQKLVGYFFSYFNWLDFQEFLQRQGWEFYSSNNLRENVVEYSIFRRSRGYENSSAKPIVHQ